MQALILAGGEGTRLRPLTYTVPKPVLPLAGRPHIAYVIDWLVRHGVDDVIVSCGHLAEGDAERSRELEPGVRIRYAEEPDARGTAGAIRFAEDMLAERFFVLNGDVLCDLDLTRADRAARPAPARGRRSPSTRSQDPTGYGLVHRQDDGEITEFLEKPEPDQIDTDEINAGAYLLERSVLDEIPPDRAVSIEREVFPRAGRRWPLRDPAGGLLDRHRDPRALPGGELGHPRGTGRRPSTARVDEPAMVAAGCEVSAVRGAPGRRAWSAAGSAASADGAVIERSVLLDGCVVEDGARVVEQHPQRAA